MKSNFQADPRDQAGFSHPRPYPRSDSRKQTPAAAGSCVQDLFRIEKGHIIRNEYGLDCIMKYHPDTYCFILIKESHVEQRAKAVYQPVKIPREQRSKEEKKKGDVLHSDSYMDD